MPDGNLELKGLLGDWRWRLDNLYWITDETGHRVRFRLNWAQEQLWNELHYLNLILKARQLGFTTFIQLFMLDNCLFNSNIRAGTIAHTLDDAKIIFRDKVRYPYDNLPDQLKNAVSSRSDTAMELVLSNNSSLRVGTSLRSGTMQILHISEYGKICAKFPEKAREVRTGALNTIAAGMIAFIESTAEGQEGHFFDLCEEARAKQRRDEPMTELDFKFNFFPWWRNPAYRLAGRPDQIPADLDKYFNDLQLQHGIQLEYEQRLWYAKKAEVQLADMKREYPSTPDEAFEASVEGAYYAAELARAELEGRIGNHPALVGQPVHTVWDIGTGSGRDSTTIWFFQIFRGKIGVVGYYGNSGEGAPFYIKELIRLAKEKGWKYGQHWFPHDARVKEWGVGKTRLEQLIEAGIKPRLVPAATIDDGINAVRAIMPICYFDKPACEEGIKALKAYRKEWDEEHGIWRNNPRKDWACDPADAFRYLAMSHREPPKKKEPPPPIADPGRPAVAQVRLSRLFEDREKITSTQRMI